MFYNFVFNKRISLFLKYEKHSEEIFWICNCGICLTFAFANLKNYKGIVTARQTQKNHEACFPKITFKKCVSRDFTEYLRISNYQLSKNIIYDFNSKFSFMNLWLFFVTGIQRKIIFYSAFYNILINVFLMKILINIVWNYKIKLFLLHLLV